MRFPQSVPPNVDELSAEESSRGRTLALRLAREGRTHGSVVQQLRRAGFDEFWAQAFADQAISVLAFRKRVTGLLVSFVGVAVLVLAGWTALILRWQKISVTLAMSGVFVLGLGVANLFHRSRLRPNQGTGSKIR